MDMYYPYGMDNEPLPKVSPYNLIRFEDEGRTMYSVIPKPRNCSDGNWIYASESSARKKARELHGYSKIARRYICMQCFHNGFDKDCDVCDGKGYILSA